MNHFEAWIADCRLQEIESGDEFQGIVAVWADSDVSFRSRLETNVEPLGYRLIGIRDFGTALSFMSKAPKKQHLIISGAQAVHTRRILSIVSLEPVTPSAPETADQGYVRLTEYDVKPLPDRSKLPSWERGWVTPELKQLLFGQPENQPKLRTYLLLDAGLRKSVSGVFDLDGPSMDVSVRCLFKGEAGEDLKEVAPYLVDMTLSEPGNTGTVWIPSFHEDFFENHWKHNTGIFIRSTAPMDEVWSFLRKFTKLPDEDGKILFFRFWAPTTFFPLGRYFRKSDRLATAFFSESIESVLLKHPDKDKVIEYKSATPRKRAEKAIIENGLKDDFGRYVRYRHVRRLMSDIDELLIAEEPDLKDKVLGTSRSWKFRTAKNLVRLGIRDRLEAAAISSIWYRTGIDILTDKDFHYITRNPLLPPSAKARQFIMAYMMLVELKGTA